MEARDEDRNHQRTALVIVMHNSSDLKLAITGNCLRCFGSKVPNLSQKDSLRELVAATYSEWGEVQREKYQ